MATTNNQSVATVDFTVTLQPGDNFKVAAACSQEYLDELLTDGLDIIDREARTLPDSPRGKVTPLLTVWRKAYVERDIMTRPPLFQNAAFGNVTAVQAVTAIESRLSIDLDLDEENRFEDGLLLVPPDTQPFQVLGNTDNFLPSINPDTVDVRNNGVVPQTGGFSMVDDDVAVLLSPTGDRDGRLVLVDLALAQAQFRRAYIEITPATAIGVADDADVPFVLNVNPTRILDMVLDTASFTGSAGARRTHSSTDDFWTVVLTSCFQGDPDEDVDPVTPLLHAGLSAVAEGIACVFMETTQDDDFVFAVGDDQFLARSIALHELDHLLGAEHSDEGAMDPVNSNDELTDASLDRIRCLTGP